MTGLRASQTPAITEGVSIPDKSSFRPDIEGMRAVAIGAVLLCHAGLPFLAGGYVGVDVFFVISGFLITRLLLGELDRTGGISLRRFYARRARRLLPLTAVLLASVGGGLRPIEFCSDRLDHVWLLAPFLGQKKHPRRSRDVVNQNSLGARPDAPIEDPGLPQFPR